jgi:hypothetical protein
MPGRVLGGGDSIVIPPDAWRDTAVHLPDDLLGRKVRDAFSGERVEVGEMTRRLDRLLSTFPVALLATGSLPRSQ